MGKTNRPCVAVGMPNATEEKEQSNMLYTIARTLPTYHDVEANLTYDDNSMVVGDNLPPEVCKQFEQYGINFTLNVCALAWAIHLCMKEQEKEDALEFQNKLDTWLCQIKYDHVFLHCDALTGNRTESLRPGATVPMFCELFRTPEFSSKDELHAQFVDGVWNRLHGFHTPKCGPGTSPADRSCFAWFWEKDEIKKGSFTINLFGVNVREFSSKLWPNLSPVCKSFQKQFGLSEDCYQKLCMYTNSDPRPRSYVHYSMSVYIANGDTADCLYSCWYNTDSPRSNIEACVVRNVMCDVINDAARACLVSK